MLQYHTSSDSQEPVHALSYKPFHHFLRLRNGTDYAISSAKDCAARGRIPENI